MKVSQVLTDHIAAHALQLDSTDPLRLKEAGFEFDTVIVAIGNYLQESIITTLNVKGGCPCVVAKASSGPRQAIAASENRPSFILKTRPVVRWLIA